MIEILKWGHHCRARADQRRYEIAEGVRRFAATQKTWPRNAVEREAVIDLLDVKACLQIVPSLANIALSRGTRLLAVDPILCREITHQMLTPDYRQSCHNIRRIISRFQMRYRRTNVTESLNNAVKLLPREFPVITDQVFQVLEVFYARNSAR
jgi:hypothetical protein